MSADVAAVEHRAYAHTLLEPVSFNIVWLGFLFKHDVSLGSSTFSTKAAAIFGSIRKPLNKL